MFDLKKYGKFMFVIFKGWYIEKKIVLDYDMFLNILYLFILFNFL